MAKLLLVKHARPVMQPDVPAPRWVLSDEGRASCSGLANALSGAGVTRVYASLEPKALETASLACARLGLAVHPRPGLHENDRTGLAFAEADVHARRFHDFFDEPARVSMGQESADAAHARFIVAVRAAVAESSGETLAVVAHGTVITLLVSRANGVDPYGLWESLGMPSWLTVDPKSFVWDREVRGL
ncbi:MAG TPA: histidine phosphatase family protein [Phenylobacterium sp.]